jgi:hypothetical protein
MHSRMPTRGCQQLPPTANLIPGSMYRPPAGGLAPRGREAPAAAVAAAAPSPPSSSLERTMGSSWRVSWSRWESVGVGWLPTCRPPHLMPYPPTLQTSLPHPPHLVPLPVQRPRPHHCLDAGLNPRRPLAARADGLGGLDWGGLVVSMGVSHMRQVSQNVSAVPVTCAALAGRRMAPKTPYLVVQAPLHLAPAGLAVVLAVLAGLQLGRGELVPALEAQPAGGGVGEARQVDADGSYGDDTNTNGRMHVACVHACMQLPR